jgi:hypothetical protein
MKTSVALLAVLFAAAASGGAPKAPTHDPREAHLADLAQLTSGGENAEAYWSPDGRELVFQSTRPPQAGADCPPPPDRSQGYVWPIDGNFEIWSARPDGGDLVRLTENTAYDAETTVCPVDGSLLFTSSRDGDLELYPTAARFFPPTARASSGAPPAPRRGRRWRTTAGSSARG